MRRYSEDALRAVNEHVESFDTEGLTVIVKPSPNEPRKGYMDRILWEQIKDSAWLNGGGKQEEPQKPLSEVIEDMRDHMGGFNENINAVEIYTEYETLQVDGHSVGLWRYYPRRSRKRTDRPALMYIHGGGWMGGSVYVVENACRFIAEKADAVVFNVDYSLAPERPYPNGLNDNYAALCHISDHAADYGIDSNRISVGGDSAGANYTAAVALMARDKNGPHIAKQVLLYAPVLRGEVLPSDYEWDDKKLGIATEQLEIVRPLLQLGRPLPAKDDFNYMLYCGLDRDPSDPYISPAMAASHRNLPPALLFSGEFDGLCIQTEYYAKLLHKAGVPVRCVRYRGLGHAFLDMIGFLPQTEDMCVEIADAL